MFKQLAALFLSVVLVITIAIPAHASNFTPSVEAKPAPEVATQTGSDGNEYAAIIKDSNGEEVVGVESGYIVVTPVAEKSEATEVVEENLDNAYEQINTVSELTDLFDSDTTEDIDVADPEVYTTDHSNPLVAAIAEYRENVAANEESKSITVEDVVVRDLFDVTISEEYADYLATEGNYLTIRFELSADANTMVTALHNIEGDTWEAISGDRIIRNDDRTVDINFYSLSPIAFVFDSTQLNTNTDTETPAPAETGINAIVWIAGGCVVVAGAAYILTKKRSTQKV